MTQRRLFRCACLSAELRVMSSIAGDWFWIRCEECKATGPRARDREHAARAWNTAHQAEEDARQATRLIERAARDQAKAQKRAEIEKRRWLRGGWTRDPTVRSTILGCYVGPIELEGITCQGFQYLCESGARRGNTQAFVQQYLAPLYSIVPGKNTTDSVNRILHAAGHGWYSRPMTRKTGAYAGKHKPQKERYVDIAAA